MMVLQWEAVVKCKVIDETSVWSLSNLERWEKDWFPLLYHHVGERKCRAVSLGVVSAIKTHHCHETPHEIRNQKHIK